MQETQPEPPMYVRWIAENCPYALEMRLDLISRLKTELNQAGATGSEIGGVFFGVLPTQESPTLRIEDLIIVPGAINAGQSGVSLQFSLDAAQIQHLSELSGQSLASGRPFVGFFRSHLRSTPLVPTREDATMLAQLFPEGNYAFWMLGPRIKRFREAAFFLAFGGHLPGIPSTPPFPFDETKFQSVREVPAEATEDVRNFNFGKPGTSRPFPWLMLLACAVLICLLGTWAFGGRISQSLRPESNQIDLSVLNVGNNLKITWDHAAPIVNDATRATVVIMDGTSHRELKLTPADLKFGQVSYERLTKKVYVVVTLDMKSGKVPPQTFDWMGE